MQFFHTVRGTLFTLLGGVAALLAMTLPSLWPLSVAGVAGYLLGCNTSSWKKAFVHGLIFGMLASMGGVWWFWDTIPLTWISIPDGTIQYLLVGIVYGLTVLSLALPFAFFAPLIRLIPHKWYQPAVVALIYVVLEEVRMWTFALFFLAPESMLAPNFSVGGLGYALTESALLLPVAQAGHYGLHGLLALLAAALLARTQSVRWAYAAVLITLIGLAHLVLPTMDVERTTRVGLVSSYAPPGPFTNPALVIAPMQQAARAGAEIIVTPESLGLAPFLDTSSRQAFYRTLFAGEGLVISSSVVREDNGNERAELLYETPTDGVIGSQDKIFFVPVGEYLPPLIRIGISVVGKENLNGYGSYIAGTAIPGSSLTPATYADITYGALLCSELLSPQLYAGLAAKNTDVLLNLANNSWFNGSRLLHERLQQVAKTHALRNRQYVLVASNGSPSYVISSRGDVVAESTWGVPGALVVDVPVSF